jgi:hypothetical protein
MGYFTNLHIELMNAERQHQIFLDYVLAELLQKHREEKILKKWAKFTTILIERNKVVKN